MIKYFSFILMLLGAAVTGTAQSENSGAGPTSKVPTAATTKTPAEQVAKVKVFPNPATNVVNVLGLKNTSKADIKISDIYGNTHLAYQWAIQRNAVNIPISALDPGAYVIYIRSEEQQVRMKFYKQ